jgi:branched-chain amino acid transport system ATP-binding protein
MLLTTERPAAVPRVAASSAPMLQVEGLQAWYGTSHILQGIGIEIGRGEIVCLIGRNGAGKTTTLKSIMGLLPKVKGRVVFEGEDLLPLPAQIRFRRGLAYVPEERRIVAGLTVRENLRLGLVAAPNKADEVRAIDKIATIFPRLAERLDQTALTMSGGEQQMLAIARAMIAEPKLIMLDEPSEGIMPVLVDEMFALFGRLRDEGTTMLLVEQNVELALDLADRAYIIDQGAIVHHAPTADLRADDAIKERYCSV